MQAQKNKEMKELKELRKLIPEKRREDFAKVAAEVLKTQAAARDGGKKKKNTKRKRRSSPDQTGTSYDIARVMKQMILPIECGGAESLAVTPNENPASVCVRHIHKVVDVNSAMPNLANGVTLVMSPDLSLPGFISGTTDALIPAVPGPLGFEGYFAVEEDYSLSGTDVVYSDCYGQIVAGGGSDKRIIELTPISDGVTTLLGFNVTALPATRVTNTVENVGTSTGRLKLWYRVAAGLWTLTDGLPHTMTHHQTASRDFNTVANVVSFAFSITPTDADGDYQYNFDFGFDSTQIVAAGITTLAPGFAPFLEGKGVTSGRVISMSVLASNTSADLANGGNITAARAPRKVHPWGNVTTNVADLPENRRYQGPAKTGAYVTWLPSQGDEFAIDDIPVKIKAYRHSEYLLVRIDGWPAGASFRFHLDWVVEFYTKSQLFEKIEAPPMDDLFRQLLYLALSLDAATCNPGHIDLIRDYVRKGIGYGKKAVQFYGNNKLLIDSVLSALVSMI